MVSAQLTGVWCGYRFAITGSSDKLVRLWSIEEVYKQAAKAAWGVHDPAPLTPADSAQSTHTAAVAEDGQEVLQGTPLLWQDWASVIHFYLRMPLRPVKDMTSA